ncbi:hypothetical protein AZE42_10137 [Rhizopogon vesiculosus]|uniref:Uncharacterized protein n=1 Tax=Rhizopogon vesiculosus TaxID=180088 RepID=A0A1J8PU42_9AGAM|nr:hypothetical protein AZE42_10137 [Rhizopogon vesiculosus]
MWSSTLECITSSIAAANTSTSDEIQNLAGKGWEIWNSLRDKSSDVAGAFHRYVVDLLSYEGADSLPEELHSLSASAHKLFLDELLRSADAGESLWNKVIELGPNLKLSTEGLFQHAMEHYFSEKIAEFKVSVDSIANTTTLHQLVLEAAEKHGITIDSMNEELVHIFHAAFEELKVKFPTPDEASGHDSRTTMINAVLDRIEEDFIQFAIKQGVSEELLKSHFTSLKFHVQLIVVIIGTDLVEQHPNFAITLLVATIVMLLPELWLLRQVLHLFGIGGVAAWLQRWLFGAAVPAGGWFATLQYLAMKAVAP